MIHIVNDDITLSKGNSLVVNIELFDGDEPYTPEAGERLIFSLKRAINDDEYVMQKDITNLVLELSPKETNISVGKYLYDIVLFGENKKDTVIGPKGFIIKGVVNNELQS